METNQTWARPGLDANAQTVLSGIEHGLTVSLITTPRHQLVCCGADEPVQRVAQRVPALKFDFLPVQDDRGDFVGLFEITPLVDITIVKTGRVDQSPHFQRLRERNLIAANAGILRFMSSADEYPCRLVLSDDRIVGLVSLSDLQRLPVRPVIFLLISHLELLMTEVIRQRFGSSDEWLLHLSPTRQSDLREAIAASERTDMYVDALLMTQLCDKRVVIQQSCHLPTPKAQWKRELERIEKLRNLLVHFNDYANTPDQARQSCVNVRLAQNWIEKFVRGSVKPAS